MNIKIFIDGGSRGNPGPGASGIVIKDARGNLLAAEGKFLGQCTNNIAEFSSLYFALCRAEKLGARGLEIFSDSQLLVNQFNGKYKVKSPHLAQLLQQIRVKAKKFARLSLLHIAREYNAEADKLVNITLDKAAKGEIFAEPPSNWGGTQLSLF